MKTLDQIEEEVLQKGMVNHRRTPFELFKAFRKELCPECKKKKSLLKAWQALIKRVLYDKRSSDRD